MRTAVFLLCSLSCSAALSAQDAALLPEQRSQLLESFRELPIFAPAATHEASDPGYYALRERYKVELGHSFLFVPALGAEAPENLPLRWTTRAIHRGAAALETDAAARIAHEDWSYAIHQPGYVERYELRDEGLELSWVLHELPDGVGDLLVEGRIETPTRAAIRGFAHGELSFCDERGERVLVFGAALAYDARGRRIDVPTSWDGEMARLRVPADWLAGAELPIVIDPLVSGPSLTVPSTSRPLSSIDLVVVDTAVTRKLFVAFTLAYSATDHDVYAAMLHEDLSGVQRVFVDLTTANSDTGARVAFNEAASQFLVATQRDYSSAAGAFSGIRLYFHDRDSLVENSGLVMQLEGNGVASLSKPALGGSDPYFAPTSRVLLVYQYDVTTSRENTLHSEIYARPIDLASRTPLAAYRAGAYAVGLSYDRGHPTVSPVMGTQDGGWLVSFVEIDRSVTGDDWDVRGTLTNPDGTLLWTQRLADAGGQRHCVHPRVAGRDGKYLLVYGRSPSLNEYGATELLAQRLQWPTFQNAPSFTHPTRLVDSVATSSLGCVPGKLELDRFSQNLWGLAYLRGRTEGGALRQDAIAVELGSTGGLVQSGVAFSLTGETAVLPTLASLSSEQEWRVMSGSATVARPIATAALELVWAGTQIVASGCGGGVVTGLPLAGNDGYFCELQAESARPAVLILGLLPTSLPLDGLGMTGCQLGVDPSFWLATFSQVTDAQGRARQPLPLPDAPVFFGDFCLQWVYASPGANALGLRTSNAILVRVR